MICQKCKEIGLKRCVFPDVCNYCCYCDKITDRACTHKDCPKAAADRLSLITGSEILKRTTWPKENKQMTREEAIAKVGEIIAQGRQSITGPEALIRSSIVDSLEALGLLKFEQKVEAEKSKPSATTVIRNELENQGPSSNYSHLANKIINELMKQKYKIVDTDVCDIVDKRQKSLNPSLLHHCALALAVKDKSTVTADWVAIASIVLEAHAEYWHNLNKKR